MTSLAVKFGDAQEFDFSDADFRQIAHLIHTRAGIKIGPEKRDMVYSRVSRRLRAMGMDSFREYLGLVEGSASETQVLVNSLTTNHTFFNREAHHFQHLVQIVRNEWKPALTTRQMDHLRLWSAASSSGEEALTMAIVLAENLGLSASVDWRILATDIDSDIIAKARLGVYSKDALKNLPSGMVQKYFSCSASNGGYTVIPELKRRIQFNQLNLHDDWPMHGQFDAIFCRNVMIYFDARANERLVGRLARKLQPNGYLYIGHSETLHAERNGLIAKGKTVYQKRKGSKADA